MSDWRKSKYKSPVVCFNSEWETVEIEEIIMVNNPNYNPNLTLRETLAQKQNPPKVNQIDKTIEKKITKTLTQLKTNR